MKHLIHPPPDVRLTSRCGHSIDFFERRRDFHSTKGPQLSGDHAHTRNDEYNAGTNARKLDLIDVSSSRILWSAVQCMANVLIILLFEMLEAHINNSLSTPLTFA